MNEERELERHNRVLRQIEEATKREELPKVGFPTIAAYLANAISFGGKKISQTLYQPVIDEIMKHGFLFHPDVKNALIKVIIENYPDVSDERIVDTYQEVLSSKRIPYILIEINQKNIKSDEFTKEENLEEHNKIVKDIKQAYEIKNLPKVGLSELNKKLLRAVNDNDFFTNIKTSEIKELTDAYLNHSSEIENVVRNIVSRYNLKADDAELMEQQIVGSLMLDETIEYTLEEIALKEQRKLHIYRLNHDETMEYIKQANRISQLPPNLTISTLNNYLNGNTTIYTNDDRITSDDLRALTSLLMDGLKWEDKAIVDEVRRIAGIKYPEKEDANKLLYDKLSSLPRTYYLVEEIKYSLERQVEFIGRGSSNVNVYFIPNNKSPLDGGRFYNCYINRVGNLDLSQILPLDLDSIVPPDMDIDSVEWYVQEYHDPTFKTAGGIILNRDETIGNVSVFKPNDGTVGVTVEQKEKIDEIDDLDAQIEEKKKILSSLNDEIDIKEKKSQDVEARMQQIISDYEQKTLALQLETLTNINALKNELGITTGEDSEGGKRLLK